MGGDWTTYDSLDRGRSAGLRELIARYGTLRTVLQGAEHRRGQQFNALVADVLRQWGIDAEANVRGVEGRDEIDVSFSIGDAHYVLEAKWTARPLSDDPIVKLADRVRGRFGGTRGVVLSMSGYTKHAAGTAERSRHPEILLLDRPHFDAMLAGLISPQDLLRALVRRASRRGGMYTPLTEILLPQKPAAPPTFAASATAAPPWDTVRETAEGISGRPVLVGNADWHAPSGVGAGKRAHTVLVTVPDAGIVEADIDQGRTRWALPLLGCRGSPLIDSGGNLVSLCNSAVVRWRNRSLEVIGGGFTAASNLLPGPDGRIWVCDNSDAGNASPPTLTGLGKRLGDQQQHKIDFPAWVWNAAWLERRRFFLAGDGYSGVVDLDTSLRISREAWIESPQSGPRPIVVRDAETVITAAREQGVRGSVFRTNLTTGSHDRLVHLTVNSVQGLITLGDDAYLLADVRGNDPNPLPLLIQLTGMGGPGTWSTAPLR